MPTNTSTIFFRAMFIGCSEPALRSGPGRVTSMASAASRAAFSFSASAFSRASSWASSAARTSLTIWPIFGRSSGGSLPMPRSSAVSSPFLPSAATRICSSAPVARASSMFCITRSRISRSIFSIIVTISLLHKKIAPHQGRSAIAPRGTTHVCRVPAASHRDNGDESVRAYLFKGCPPGGTTPSASSLGEGNALSQLR